MTTRVIGEQLFTDVLHRERRRTDRSGESVGLLVVCPETPDDTAPTWDAIVNALTATKRDTDIVGWFDQGNALGVILPDIDVMTPALAKSLDRRIHEQLAKRLDTPTMERLATRLYFYPELDCADEDLIPALHPLPEPVSPRTRQTALQEAIKRTVDVVGSAFLLVLLAPLLLAMSVLIKLKSPGPVFFRQVRIGRMMKPFTMLKFRTMHANADHAIHQQFVSNFINSKREPKATGGDVVFKITADPRVTPIGRFLRKTSFDELPQLLNVLRGDMSLVGPRPPLPYEVEQYQRWHRRRVLEAKPGLTGPWQVAGRSRTTFDEMVRLDLRYANTCSLWTDVKILFATPGAVIVGKGAV